MKIRIVFFGKEKDLSQREKELIKRIGYFSDLQIMPMQSQSGKDELFFRKKEGELLQKKISPSDYLVILDEKGETLTSKEFSNWFKKIRETKNEICFAIGGASGWSEEIKKRANKKISLSSMTWTHDLARHMFLEQLYRAIDIERGGKFHKE